MTLLETYKPMREYITKYLNSKTGFYSNVAIFNRLNRIEIHINCDMPFEYLIKRFHKLKVAFIIEPNRDFEDKYIVLAEDEYLKLYALCRLHNEL